jgi:hypothetical protein
VTELGLWFRGVNIYIYIYICQHMKKKTKARRRKILTKQEKYIELYLLIGIYIYIVRFIVHKLNSIGQIV